MKDRSDCGYSLTVGETHIEQHCVERRRDGAGDDQLRCQRQVAMRADDAEPVLMQLLRAGRTDQEGNVASGLSEPGAEIATHSTGTDTWPV